MNAKAELAYYKALVRKLQNEIMHDQMTGLGNRKLLEHDFNQALEDAKRNRSQFAVLVIDVDKFKTINDTLGHSCGDSILKMVAQGLSQNVRKSDTVARIGGDEFVVLLRDIKTMDDVVAIAEKLKNLFPEDVNVGADKIPVHFSIGIALYSIESSDYESLFNNADQALYQVKQNGRNNYRIYNQLH